MSLFWFGQGVSWGGHSMFCVLCFLFLCVWPGVVLNQRLLSEVAFSHLCFVGICFMFFVSAPDRTVSVSVVLFVVFVIQCSVLLKYHEHVPPCALVHFFKQPLHISTSTVQRRLRE